MNLNAAEKLANSLIKKHLSARWTFKWNRRTSSFGLCNHTTEEIQLSKILTEHETVEHVTNTILHEIAHALAGPFEKHGPRWKQIARSLGLKNPTASTTSSAMPTERKSMYKWALMFGDEMVRGFHRKPGARMFQDIGELYVRGRKAETFGKLRIVKLG